MALRFKETERGSGSSTTAGDGKIRCPKCAWQPERGSRWSCACGHAWNTFDTRGMCPACDAVWRDTQCLRCGQWSLHEAWYASR
jgi:hypothetical protein